MAGQGTSGVLHQLLTAAAASPKVGNCRPSFGGRDLSGNGRLFIAVQDKNGKPLMPYHPALVRKGMAVRRFSKGIFYIRLTERVGGAVRAVACGIDPGSKREGYTVESEKRTLLNVQAEAVDGVRKAVEIRRMMRRARRRRNTPCRANWQNRACGGLPQGQEKKQRRWDAAFSPLEVWKKWFYEKLGETAPKSVDVGRTIPSCYALPPSGYIAASYIGFSRTRVGFARLMMAREALV